MSRRPLSANGPQSTDRQSFESRSSFDLSIEDPESQILFSPSYSHSRPVYLSDRLQSFSPEGGLGVCCRNFLRRRRAKRRGGRKIWCQYLDLRRLCFLFRSFFAVAILLAVFVAVVRPSYSSPPARYHELRRRVETSTEPGRANPGTEKVFIASSIYDHNGDLVRGAWGQNILELIHLLGPSNVFLSIYGNGAVPAAEVALNGLGQKTTCQHEITFEEQLDPNEVPHIQLPDGTTRTKRIAYLAEVRNRALRPLAASTIKYDKLLYLNDVVFDPVDAVQLLFATNAESGKADYRAACSMDFINPFKFYDTFASRDLEGYSMGLPLYPWFSSAGNAQSRKDVFEQKDAVRVKSCWGGMVAFDAKFFQPSPDEVDDLDVAGVVHGQNFTGFRFRAEEDLFWDAAECCLIQADIQKPDKIDTGIYMNPYIRVAYETTTLSWLGWSRRIDRLYTLLQYVTNILAGLPHYNPRRDEQAWQEVQEKVWSPDATLPTGGSFKLMERTASHAGFCGRRALQVLKQNPKLGEKNWEFIAVPNP